MLLTSSIVSGLVNSILNGPVNKALEGFIKDVELRRKLQAELEARLTEHADKALALEKDVVMAEVQSEHWLSRSWRPILMLSLLGFLGLVGVILPVLDWIVGTPVPFNPRWQSLPPQFWDFLTVGVGGYIGGRSLEKVAQQVLVGKGRK
jgi:Holin of 3TMs, for gene-transfer release